MKRIIFHALLALTALSLSTTYLLADTYSQGVTRYMRKDYEEARTLLAQALEEDPSNGNAYYYLGEIEKNTKNYPAAINYYIKALENRLNQKYVKLTYWNLIILTEQRNDLNGMVKTCKAFYRKTGDPGAKEKVDTLINKMLWTNNQEAINSYNEGKSLQNSGKTSEAKTLFEAALREDSSFLAARFELGMIAHKNGETDDALRQLHVIADKIPFYTSVQQLTADMYMQHRSWSNAKKYYTNVIEYGFINNTTLRSTLVRRGQCYFQLRRYSQAEEDILRAQEIRETNGPKKVLSAIYIKKRQYDEALAILQELEKTYPSDADIQYQIGSIYYRQKDEAYLTSFKRLYQLTQSMRNLPEKYQKPYLLVATDSYNKEDFATAASIFKHIPAKDLSYNDKIAAATSFYNQQNYSDSRDILNTARLTDKDKILLSKAYIKTGEVQNAKAVMRPLVISSPFSQTVLDDPVLKSAANEILAEEEQRKREAEAAQPTVQPAADQPAVQ